MSFAARAPVFSDFLYSHSKCSLMLPVTSSLITSKGLKLTCDQRLHFDSSGAIKCEYQVGCLQFNIKSMLKCGHKTRAAAPSCRSRS